MVTNIYTNRYTSTGRTGTTIYGREQDAKDEFVKRVKRSLSEEVSEDVDRVEFEIEIALANGCYQYNCGEDIVVIAIDSDVVN